MLYGCYVPTSGTVYRIKATGLPDACRSPQHVQFTWSLQGPVGPQGAGGSDRSARACGTCRRVATSWSGYFDRDDP